MIRTAHIKIARIVAVATIASGVFIAGGGAASAAPDTLTGAGVAASADGGHGSKQQKNDHKGNHKSVKSHAKIVKVTKKPGGQGGNANIVGSGNIIIHCSKGSVCINKGSTTTVAVGGKGTGAGAWGDFQAVTSDHGRHGSGHGCRSSWPTCG